MGSQLGEQPLDRWHSMSADDVLSALDSTTDGLSADEATSRRERYGPNEIEQAEPASRLRMLLAEFTNPLILILIGAGALLLAVSAVDDEEVQRSTAS